MKKMITLEAALTKIIANSAKVSRASPEVKQAVKRVIHHMQMEIGALQRKRTKDDPDAESANQTTH